MNPVTLHAQNGAAVQCEEVEVQGHIIDSLMLPKILDCILNNGGTFRIQRITIGQSRHDPSYALLEVLRRRSGRAGADPGADRRSRSGAGRHAGLPAGGRRHRGRLSRGLLQHDEPAHRGAVGGGLGRRSRTRRWTAAFSSTRPPRAARCVPMNECRRGDPIVVGHAGVRVFPEQRSRDAQAFAFMDSGVSTEKPKGLAIREIARDLAQHRAAGGKTLLVGRPGDHPHRQRRVPAAIDPHGLYRRPLRRQCPGDA